MKRAVRSFATVIAFLFLLIPALEAADQAKTNTTSVPPMTLWQARRAVVANSGMAYVQLSRFRLVQVDPRSLRFTAKAIEFDTIAAKIPSEHMMINLRQDGGASVKCNRARCDLTIGPGQGLPVSVPHLFWNDNSKVWSCSSGCMQQANAFVAALNRLSAYASDEHDPLREFSQRAAAWRALATKPALPETTRVRRLMAEDALKNQKPEEALKYYEQGLDLCPMWPEGWFNAAVVAGELGRYADAAEEMQNYLELVPNAKDAQAARDQIAIWQYKAGQPATGVAR